MYAYFDLATLAAAIGVSGAHLRELETCIREQYGSDEMLIELRLLRTLHAIGEGGVSEADAIRELGEAGTGGRLYRFLEHCQIADDERGKFSAVLRAFTSDERLLLTFYYYERMTFAAIAVVFGEIGRAHV